MKTKPRLAVVGLGNMGRIHCHDIKVMENVTLSCVCDANRDTADALAQEFGVPAFSSTQEMFDADLCDGVVIATPHYSHTTIALQAFAHRVHVLTEKPVAVHTSDIDRMVESYQRARAESPGLVFAAMFQQRTHSQARAIKELIDSGELGRLIRTTWIITDWYRTQSYYNSGGWRATWRGEGGGVLMNQCPHQLDLYQWFVGLPQRVRGFCSFGKYHDIEVEDEVSAYFEHENGMVGHFITSTGEAPGTNRLEIVGEHGKLVWEGRSLLFHRNRQSLLTHLRQSTDGFTKPECRRCEIPAENDGGLHRTVTERFRDAIATGSEPIAYAREGRNSTMIDNAIRLSSWDNAVVELPLDAARYERSLRQRIEASPVRSGAPTAKRHATTGEGFAKSF